MSKGYTPHAFVAHSRIPINVVAKMQHALINIENNPEGKTLLKELRLKGIEKAVDSDWNDIRLLKLSN